MKAKSKEFFHSRPIFYGFLALLLAIYSSRYIFDGNVSYIVFIAVCLLGLMLYCVFYRRFTSLIVILCFFAFGLGWFFVGQSAFVSKSYEETCQIVGRISDDISYSSYGTSATVILKDVSINDEKSGNIRLTIYFEDEDFQAGDVISFEAELENSKLFTFKNFNSHYYRDSTPYIAQVNLNDITTLATGKLSLDEQFRLMVKGVLYSNMGERNGAVAMAVLFGDKSAVDSDIYESYKTAGIIHLLTVSGLHVGFLITLLGWILRKCKVKGIWNFCVCAFCLLAYAYLCGFAPSVLRAGIMGLVLLATKLSGKCYDNLNTLGLAGIIILLCSPLSALDSGFLMSFFCVLGIFTITPWLSKLFRKIFPKAISESFAVSIGAQIGILPFVASFYSTLNFLTFFINLIVIPIFSVIYPVLFLGIFIVALMPFMGFILKVCGFGLDIVYEISNFLGQTQLAIDLEPLNFIIVGLACLLFFLFSRFFMASKNVKTFCGVTLTGIICLLTIVFNLPTQKNAVLAYCFNYSNGMVVLRNKSNQTIIVDVGYSSFTKNTLKELEIDDVNSVFVLNDTTVNIDTARDLGVKNIIRTGTKEGYDEEVVYSLNDFGIVGGFSFRYIGLNDKVLALGISCDETKILVIKERTLTNQMIDVLNQVESDIIILGQNEEYGTSFKKEERLILSYSSASSSDISYQDDGNVAYLLKEKQWRCLD